MDANNKITNYLTTHGPMSGRDICDDCGVDELDVDFAEHDGEIVRCAPAHGGVDPWYCNR